MNTPSCNRQKGKGKVRKVVEDDSISFIQWEDERKHSHYVVVGRVVLGSDDV